VTDDDSDPASGRTPIELVTNRKLLGAIASTITCAVIAGSTPGTAAAAVASVTAPPAPAAVPCRRAPAGAVVGAVVASGGACVGTIVGVAAVDGGGGAAPARAVGCVVGATADALVGAVVALVAGCTVGATAGARVGATVGRGVSTSAVISACWVAFAATISGSSPAGRGKMCSPRKDEQHTEDDGQPCCPGEERCASGRAARHRTVSRAGDARASGPVAY